MRKSFTTLSFDSDIAQRFLKLQMKLKTTQSQVMEILLDNYRKD